jgi:hypothetical protein
VLLYSGIKHQLWHCSMRLWALGCLSGQKCRVAQFSLHILPFPLQLHLQIILWVIRNCFSFSSSNNCFLLPSPVPSPLSFITTSDSPTVSSKSSLFRQVLLAGLVISCARSFSNLGHMGHSTFALTCSASRPSGRHSKA